MPDTSSSLLFDFTTESADEPGAWRSIDDPVMGGISQSAFVAGDKGAAFTGTVSLDHGGGFASVRAPEDTYDLDNHDEFRLRLRGDGKRYWLTTYTDASDSISYRAPVEPPERWTTIDVAFRTLTPYRRGTEVPDAPPFDPSRLRTFGFLIADEQDGPFRLEVQWIRSCEAETRS